MTRKSKGFDKLKVSDNALLFLRIREILALNFITTGMSRLYKQLRIHQIFGANTGVGKTIFSTALSRASILNKKGVFYLKPVSTGAPEEADHLFAIFHSLELCILINQVQAYRKIL